jgi:molybdate transport system regulatory protein
MSDSEHAIGLSGDLWLTMGRQRLGSPARIALLEQIGLCGSITQAARAAGMSYKGAWDAIDAMNNLSGAPLVERSAGGKGGGGTTLTPRGRQLVDNYRALASAHQAFIVQIGQLQQANAAILTEDLQLMGRLAMKTSARNQFYATVARVRTGAVNDEITLTMAGGHTLAAIVTRDSSETLGLREGASVFALVKASSVMLVTDPGTARFSARNQLAGSVARVVAGAVNSEVSLALAGGLTVVAVITNDACTELALTEGAAATAMFKASDIIVCVAD